MLNDFTGADKVYIACGYTDLTFIVQNCQTTFILEKVRGT